MSAHLTHLFSVLLRRGDGVTLAEHVDRSRQQFETNGELDLWHFWKGQSLIASHEPEKALELVGQITDRDRAGALEMVALRALAEKTGDPTRLVEYLERRFQESHSGLDLFDLCSVKVEQKDWPYVAARAEELVKLVDTSAALRLAVTAAHNASQTELCLNLLNVNTKLFPNGQLPVDLRRLRIYCEQRLGLLKQAIEEAELLAKESGQLEDLSTLLGLRLRSGDMKGAVVASREYLGRKDVSADHLLYVARTIYTEDENLARELFEKALGTGERSSDFIVGAYDLAFRINREDSLRSLHPQFQELAQSGQGAVKVLTLPQMITLRDEHAQQQRQVAELYRQGRVPLHVVIHAGVVGDTTLAAAYHWHFHPAPDASEWLSATPIYVRHGGRALGVSPRNISRLYVDVTSLLLAAELGILDEVENRFGPLYVAPNLTTTLREQRENTKVPQPSRIEPMRLIQSLLAAGKLRAVEAPPQATSETLLAVPNVNPAWLSLFEAAKRENGFLVDYLPLQMGIPPQVVELPPSEQRFVTDCANVLAALVAAGKVTEDQHHAARERLTAAIGPGCSKTPLPPSSALFPHGNIIEMLAAAGILPQTCDLFRVFIEKNEIATIDATLRDWEQKERLGVWLRDLLHRINRGLEIGRYKVIAIRNDPTERLEEQSGDTDSICLMEILQAESAPGFFAWVDDRFLNAHGKCGEIPFITVLGILAELRHCGALNISSYYTKLHTLRSANIRYLPLDKEEILHHLGQAVFKDRAIIETPELATLRRQVAACMLNRGGLQMPPFTAPLPNPSGEVAFVFGICKAAVEALVAVWSDASIAEEIKVARANWILHSLWFDTILLPRLFGTMPSEAVEAKVRGNAVALLYLQGLVLRKPKTPKDNGEQIARKQYFTWLESKFGQDTETLQEIACHVRGALADENLINKWTVTNSKLFRILTSELLMDLPISLQRNLNLSCKERKALGVEQHALIKLGNQSFEMRKFWQAAEKAARGKTGHVTALKSRQAFTMRFVKRDGEAVLQLFEQGCNTPLIMNDPIIRLLDRDVRVRKAVLEEHRVWFDCGEEDFRNETRRLAEINDAPERISQIHDRQKRSAAFCYANIAERAAGNHDVDLSHFEPPSARGLLDHMRLPQPLADGQLPASLDRAAQVLLVEEGFSETFRRLATLPILMPEAMWRAYCALSIQDQTSWRKSATTEMVSPISRMHVIDFLLRGGSSTTEQAMQMLESLFGTEGEKAFEAFNKVLIWTLGRVERRPNSQDLPASTLLAVSWLHAVRLHNFLGSISSHEQVALFFGKFAHPVPRDIFRSRINLTEDVAHPRSLRRSILLLHALFAIMSKSQIEPARLSALQEQAKTLCFLNRGTARVPNVELLASTDLRGNTLGSFLGENRGRILMPLIGEETAKVFSPENSMQEADAALTALLATPPEHDRWVLLSALLGAVSPPDALREKLRTALLKTKLADLIPIEPAKRRLALFFIASHAGRFDDAELLGRMKSQLIELAQLFASESSDQELPETRALLLIECAHQLSAALKDENTAAREFAKIVMNILAVWPAAAAYSWPLFSKVIFSLPASLLAEMWPLILALRSKTNQIPLSQEPNLGDDLTQPDTSA